MHLPWHRGPPSHNRRGDLARGRSFRFEHHHLDPTDQSIEAIGIDPKIDTTTTWVDNRAPQNTLNHIFIAPARIERKALSQRPGRGVRLWVNGLGCFGFCRGREKALA